MIQRILKKVYSLYVKSTSDRYIRYLISKGVNIGEGTTVRPKSFTIDLTRPSLISIGRNCYFNENIVLLTHDWVTKVFIQSGRQFINSSGKITIGNNVSFGRDVMVLKGVTIGNNCFIGAGSIVTKDIPSDSIAVGSPCRVVMTIEEYYKKRLSHGEKEALDYAKSIFQRFGRMPLLEEMKEEFIYFVSGNDIDNYPQIPIKKQLGPTYESYKQNHVAKYKNFEEFLDAAGIK